MKFRILLALPLFLLVASCSKHALHGGWREDGSKEPRTLEFDAKSNELMVHTHTRADGGHDHLHGSYTWKDGAIHVEWTAGSAKVSFDGSVQGDRMELKGKAGESVVFVRGASAH
jgi:hypothetical protein